MKAGRFAERLRVIRAKQGLTLVQAAEKIGIDRHTLRDLELGRRRPNFDTVEKLSTGYGVPIAELMEADEAPLGEASFPPEVSEEEEEAAISGKARVSSPPPRTVAELLDAAGVTDRDLEKQKEEINALFKGASSYKETLDLARRIINARRAVYVLINSYREDPGITPQEKGALDRLDVHTMLINSIAITSAHEAAEAEAARAREVGDLAHAEEIERDKERSLVAGGV